MVANVQRGWTVLDVGANYGYYSVLLAELIGADGQLFCFEPNPDVARAAEFSLELNSFASRSTVYRTALSDRTGECAFFVPDGEPKNGHLEFGNTPSTGGDSFTVTMDTMDSFTSGLDRVDFIKIDAEGGEAGIFAGMQETIRKHNPLIVLEFNTNRGDARAFAEAVNATYPQMKFLEEDGSVRDLTVEQMTTERLGQDWLLVLQN
ncbi:MAG: FkbM family methyltransferase [Novosphingobium sp.]